MGRDSKDSETFKGRKFTRRELLQGVAAVVARKALKPFLPKTPLVEEPPPPTNKTGSGELIPRAFLPIMGKEAYTPPSPEVVRCESYERLLDHLLTMDTDYGINQASLSEEAVHVARD